MPLRQIFALAETIVSLFILKVNFGKLIHWNILNKTKKWWHEIYRLKPKLGDSHIINFLDWLMLLKYYNLGLLLQQILKMCKNHQHPNTLSNDKSKMHYRGEGKLFFVTCHITNHMSCHMSHVSLHIMCQVRSSDSQISNQIKYQLKYGEVCSQLSFQVLIQVSIPKTINIRRLNKVGRLFLFGVKLTGLINVCTLLYSFYLLFLLYTSPCMVGY